MFYHLSTPKREKEFDQMTNTRYIIESENKKRAWKVSFKSRLTTSRPPSYFSTSNKFISNSNDHPRPLSLRQPPSPLPIDHHSSSSSYSSFHHRHDVQRPNEIGMRASVAE